MQKLYILSYFSSYILYILFTLCIASLFQGPPLFGDENITLIVALIALIFPFFFYYYTLIPVVKQAWNKLSSIRKKQEPLANYFAIFGNLLSSICIPFNAMSKNFLIALVN